MRILAFESSAKAASVALLTDGLLTGEYFQNSGQTHSRTLMKMAKDLLDNCGLSPADVDLAAWANGPGSFTGVRIGAATAKGFCWGLELPCVPVSTLEAMAWSASCCKGTLCCCMDARRSQVYNAIFEVRAGKPVRLREDRAISIEALAEDLRGFDAPVRLLGDGAALVYDTLNGSQTARELSFELLPEHLRHQRASGVGLAAWEAAQAGLTQDPALVLPNYLRLSQAERERLEKRSE